MLSIRPIEDTYQQKGQRKQLIQLLVEMGITDKKVLEVMEAVPRHFFFSPEFAHYAYKNRPFTITDKQTISHPHTVALQTQLLELRKFDKVLEVGTGSTYQTCVLAMMALQVFTIERQKELFDEAKEFFYIKKFTNIRRIYGDGFAGLPTFAPFDKIIITCGAPMVPPKLLEQLKPGGIMVIPVGDDSAYNMLRIRKAADGSVTEEMMGEFRFVPMLEGRNNSKIASGK